MRKRNYGKRYENSFDQVSSITKKKILIGFLVILFLYVLVMFFGNGKIQYVLKNVISKNRTQEKIVFLHSENEQMASEFVGKTKEEIKELEESKKPEIIENTEDNSWNKDSARVLLRYHKNNTFGGVPSKNSISVYAFDGDTICLGTNVYNSGLNLAGNGVNGTKTNEVYNDEGSIDIVMYDLQGNSKAIDINGKEGSPGYIKDYKTERLAKNLTSPNGNTDKDGNIYIPYTYTVHETGVYTFEFRSYDGSSGSSDNTTESNKTKDWRDSSKMGQYIASWDITVFDENNVKKTGRTYCNSLAFQTIGTVKEQYYVLTNDSYIYQMKFNGIAPYTFSFFANNRGITDIANGNIVYKSVKDLKNTISFNKFGINFTNPSTDDTDINKNFYIFFEEPSEDLEGYMYGKAILPDPASNIKFEGLDDGVFEGSGGYFSFDVKEATTATLRLDFNIEDENGKKIEYAPVEISDVVKPYSSCSFYWDGKDGNGKVIPKGEYSYEQIKYTVTTKMGEIHFPLVDVENMTDGTTFTRINKIYDKNNEEISGKDTIYDATKNVIYYDETAIYYGEKITATGASENDVTYNKNVSISGKSVATDVNLPKDIKDAKNNNIFHYSNLIKNQSSEYIAYTNYGKDNNLRVGDHSFLNNKIDYSGEKTVSEQKKLIEYLDSETHPVGISNKGTAITTGNGLTLDGKATNYVSTTDYGIANYWTFINSKPAESENKDCKIIIKSSDKDVFNLQARVFYDEQVPNGIYDQLIDKDHLLSGVTLNLYKKTEDTEPKDNKIYVYEKEKNKTIETVTNFENIDNNIYELVKTGITPLQGSYIFTGLEYDKTNGTEYLYEVIKPNSSWKLETEKKNASNAIKKETFSKVEMKEDGSGTKTTNNSYEYGMYTLFKYNKDSCGTEIQTFTVGGSGINFEENDSKLVTTIDVGYSYNRTDYKIKIRKNWEGQENGENPNVTVFELSYDTSKGETKIYEERALSASLAWNYSFNYLDTEIEAIDLKDWFVSAEYYIYKDKVFRHKYEYDTSEGKYISFVGKDSYFSLKDYYDGKTESKSKDYVYTMEDIPDLNGDNVHDWNDLIEIKEKEEGKVEEGQYYWEEALPAGSTSSDKVVSIYNSVIDRNIGTGVTEMTITNTKNPGTIEILKYTGDINMQNYLPGATFRIYKGELETVKSTIDKYNSAQLALSKATSSDKSELEKNFKEAVEEVDKIEIGSASTRANGRVAFPALDPTETYTVRERFAPSGYRILEEYYQVNKKSVEIEDGYKFNESNYCLINVGNAEAVGNLEIRKTLQGRTWTDGDEFKFDMSIEETNIEPSGEDLTLYSENTESSDSLIKKFIENFKKSSEIKIDNNSNYIKLEDESESPDTKAYTNLLKDGVDETENASLNGVDFPVAGSYTFTIVEKESLDKTIKISPKLYTITIDVRRTLNKDAKEDGDVNLENSHLEASISKITVQDKLSETEYGETTIFAGNAPVFINTYEVEDVEQDVSYTVEKNLKGREGNKWKNTDSFTFTVDGQDDITKKAIKEGKIIIEGDFESEEEKNENDTSKKFVIDSNTPDHKFKFEKIDFKNIVFPVEETDEGPITKPIVYLLSIKEEKPNDLKDGINYSTDTYTLKMTLKNEKSGSTEHSGEKDGIIDEITLDLYKNYEEGSTPYGTCVINQSKGDDGQTVSTTIHDEKEGSHNMVFENQYAVTIKAIQKWNDNNNSAGKRPSEIGIKLVDKNKKVLYSVNLTDGENHSKTNEWSNVFENIPLYDENGEKIEYTIEQEIKDENNIFYTHKIGTLEKVESEPHTYKIENISTFEVPDTRTSIEVEKIWEFEKDKQAEKIPESLELTVSTQNDVDIPEDVEQTITLTNENKKENTDTTITWSGTFSNLPLYDKKGDKVTYSVTERNDSIFFKEEPEHEIHDSKIVIKNKFVRPENTKSLEIEKIWEYSNDLQKAKIPESLDIILKSTGKELIEEEQTLKLTGENKTEKDNSTTWKGEFKDLPVYDENGDEIKYTVSESLDSSSFFKQISIVQEENGSNKATITNSFKTKEEVAEIETVDVEVTKIWKEDNEKQKERRPEQITIKLTGSDGTENEAVISNVKASDSQKYTFKALPKYDENGDEITYTVSENPFDSIFYKQESINQNTKTITNKFKVPDEKIDVTVEKKWEDNDDEYHKRPEKLIIQLNKVEKDISSNEQREVKVEDYTLNLSTENSHTFIGLSKYDENGDEIKYKAIELAEGKDDLFYYSGVSGAIQLTDTNKYKITITNTLSKIPGFVKVKYVDRNTNKEIQKAVTLEGIVGEEFDVSENKKEIDGYTLVEEPKEKTGTYTKEDQERIFYYAKNTTVIVKYLEKDTKAVLKPENVINGYEGKEYQTEQIEIENYTFVENSNNTNGVMTIEPIEVIYWYAQNTKVIVQHIDITTQEIIKEEIVEGKVGDSLITHPEDFEGYVVVESPEEKTVTMKKETIVLKYYYNHISEGVLEKHIDIITGELIEYYLHEGLEGDSYNIESKEFELYDLVKEDDEGNSKLPENKSGKMLIGLIEVKYYYIKKANLKVEYIDKETGNKLTEDVITEGHEGDDYKTEEKEFSIYELTETKGNKEGKLTVTVDKEGKYHNETLVQYFYERKKVNVQEKHIDITTGNILSEEKHEGKINDDYNIKSKVFEGYDLVESKLPNNASGKMTEEPMVVEYYYIKRTEVEIQYVEETEEMISVPEIISGHVGDKYNSEPKIFDYYEFVRSTENAEGTMKEERIIVKYYYRKKVFNLKLEKWINSMTVNGRKFNGNTSQTQDNLLKIDLHKNGISTADVRVCYTIRITNDSEIEGTVAELKEIVPEGFSLHQEDNELIWIGKDNIYTTTDLKDKVIKPNESYDVSLVLRWNNVDGNFGKKINTVVISQANNLAEFEELSTDDNTKLATILISVATGGLDTIQIIKFRRACLVAIIIFMILFTRAILFMKRKIKLRGKHSM